MLDTAGGGVILRVTVKKGFLSLLLLGIVAVLLLLGIFIFGPWELPGFGQLSQRQVDQAISAASVPTIPPGDSDSDGFSDEVEKWIKTDPSDNCADDVNDAAWPPDFNNDKMVNDADLGMLKVQFGSRVKGENNRRYDLNADKTINLSDVFLFSNFSNKGCPFYFMSVEPLSQSVNFKWQPAISELLGGLYGIDLTATGKTQCNSPEDFVGGFAWTYDLKVGQTSYIGDARSTGSFSIKFQPGHTYCAYLFKTGGGALSSYVTYTLPAASPSPSPSPTLSPAPYGSLTVNSIGASAVPISGTQQGTSGTTSYTIWLTSASDQINTTLTAPAKWGNWVFSNWNGCNSTSGTNCTVLANTGETKLVAAIYYSSP